jgi:hypothetical protein
MSTDALETWPRPHYAPGGGTPFLFYVVFGAATGELRLSRSKYRCAGVPRGLEVAEYDAGAHRALLDDYRSGYLWDELQEGDPDLAATIAAQDRCVVLRGELQDDANLDYFRDAIGLVTCLLDHGGVAVYDPQGLRWWSADQWRDDVFAPGRMSPNAHVVILASEEDDGSTWLHTRGLRKFGRPDLSLHDIPQEHEEAAAELFSRFIQLQAFGGVIPEGEAVRMRALPPGLTCHHGGSEDDPDFNNVHVEVRWPTHRAAP